MARRTTRYTRRELLQYSLGAMAAVGAGSVLEACGSSSTSPSSSPTSPSGKPKRGGTIRAGLSGGGTSDTLDGDACVENLDFARAPQLYNVLLEPDLNDVDRLSLADEITSNKAATEWTIRLKSGITFHNGKDLTSEDVLFTLQRIVSNHFSGSLALAPADLKNATMPDKLTLKVPCHTPYSTFPYALNENGEQSIVPVGYDPKKPVGTGPFMLKSFTPGVQSVFVRNPNYWEVGADGKPLPYVDELVISDYSDETSQVNALLSGVVDCIDLLSFESLSPLKTGGKKTLISDGGGWVPFTMRVDVYPFSEVDVRQAFRLIVDRPQMRDQVFGGYGLLGNDIFAIEDPEYDHSIPQRVQDIDQAKFLLNKHHLLPMKTTLVTGPIHQGAVAAATVFAEQAAAANVKVTLSQINVTEYYGTDYLKWVFAQDWWGAGYYLPQVSFSMLPTSVWNETHWNDPAYYSLYNQALATTDVAKQTELVHEMCMIDYMQGGYIIPFFTPTIDGYSPKLVGPLPSKTGTSLANYWFKKFWFD
jgi:peptide/nickel transport system substrate-binding protein